MSEFKSMDLDKVKKSIEASNGSLGQIRSMENAKNLTANNDLEDIMPVGDRIVVSLKSWPAQSQNGIFIPDSYTLIRGEQYVTQVEAVGEDVTIVKKGDVVIISMYSGHHVTTKTGHAKIISESDILTFKKEKNMNVNLSYDPKTFSPGINYIIVKMIEKKTVKSKGGIIIEAGEDDAMNKMDVATKTAEVLAIGPMNEYGKKFNGVKVGSVIVFDAYVGIALNVGDVTDEQKYRVMYTNDILAFVRKE